MARNNGVAGALVRTGCYEHRAVLDGRNNDVAGVSVRTGCYEHRAVLDGLKSIPAKRPAIIFNLH